MTYSSIFNIITHVMPVEYARAKRGNICCLLELLNSHADNRQNIVHYNI